MNREKLVALLHIVIAFILVPVVIFGFIVFGGRDLNHLGCLPALAGISYLMLTSKWWLDWWLNW